MATTAVLSLTQTASLAAPGRTRSNVVPAFKVRNNPRSVPQTPYLTWWDGVGWHKSFALFNLKRQFQWCPRGAAVGRFNHTNTVCVSPVPISCRKPKVVGIFRVNPEVGHPEGANTSTPKTSHVWPSSQECQRPPAGAQAYQCCSSCGSMRTRLIRPAPPWVGTLRGATCRHWTSSTGGRNDAVCLHSSDACHHALRGTEAVRPPRASAHHAQRANAFRRMTATRCATPPEIQMPPEPSRGSNRGLDIHADQVLACSEGVSTEWFGLGDCPSADSAHNVNTARTSKLEDELLDMP